VGTAVGMVTAAGAASVVGWAGAAGPCAVAAVFGRVCG
jgi:hypothetical protein